MGRPGTTPLSESLRPQISLICDKWFLLPKFLSRTHLFTHDNLNEPTQCYILPNPPFFCFHSEHRISLLHCLYYTSSHPASTAPSPVRLSSPLPQQNSTRQSRPWPVPCQIHGQFIIFILLVPPAFDTLDHSQLILKIFFHSSGFPSDSLPAYSQTSFLDPLFLPVLYILRWPRAQSRTYFLHSLSMCDLAQSTQLQISTIYYICPKIRQGFFPLVTPTLPLREVIYIPALIILFIFKGVCSIFTLNNF